MRSFQPSMLHVVLAGVAPHRVGEVDHRLRRVEVRHAPDNNGEPLKCPLRAPGLVTLENPRSAHRLGQRALAQQVEHLADLVSIVAAEDLRVPLHRVAADLVHRGHQTVHVVGHVGEGAHFAAAGDDRSPVAVDDQPGDQRLRVLQGKLAARLGQVDLVEVEQEMGRGTRRRYGSRLGRVGVRLAGRGWPAVDFERAQIVHGQLPDGTAADDQFEVVALERGNLVLRPRDRHVELDQATPGLLDQAALHHGVGAGLLTSQR